MQSKLYLTTLISCWMLFSATIFASKMPLISLVDSDKQETSPSISKCKFDIYGSTTNGPNGKSHLAGFKLNENGWGVLINIIGPDIERVSAIDFSPCGTLYGVGERTSTQLSVFFSIDCQTGEATIIGRTFIENISQNNPTITDIDFDQSGRLFAFFDSSNVPNVLGSIDPKSGLFTQIGLAGPALSNNEPGNGIGSMFSQGNPLYHAGETNVSFLNKITGLATTVAPLEFIPPASNFRRINALDADPTCNVMYASVAVDDGANLKNYLTTLDVKNGVVRFLSSPAIQAPFGLDGIAVNRCYEVCEP